MLPYVTAYRSNGETAQMAPLDAREAAGNHPTEWSLTPWPAEKIKATQRAALKDLASLPVEDFPD